MNYDEQIKEKEIELTKARAVVSSIIGQVNQLKIDEYLNKTGFQIGCQMKITDRKGGVTTGVLTKVNVKYGTAEPFITLHKKDGTLGLRTKDYFYNSEKLERL